MREIILILMYVSEFSPVSGDYDCLCNYNVEKAVYAGPSASGQPIGFMYEFDCKPVTERQTVTDMYTIQYEKQVGYVTQDQKVQIQTCPGQPSATDLILSSTTSTIRPTTQAITSTTKATTQTTTSTTRPTTQTTTSTTRPTTQTTTSTVRPTTQTTTSTTRPTTQTTTSTVKPTTQTTTSTARPTIQTTTSSTSTTRLTTTSTVRPTTQTTSTVRPTTQTTSTVRPTTQTTSTVRPTTQTTSTVRPTAQTSTTRPTTQTTTSTVRPTTQKATSTTKPTTQTTTATTTATTLVTTPYWSISANVTGTPYQYVGIGYNTLKGNPDAITDPGYLTSQRIFQLTGNSTFVREALLERQTPCNSHTNTILLYGSKAYQDELKGIVRPSHFTFWELCRYAERMEQEGHDLLSLFKSIVTRVQVGTKSIDRFQTTPVEMFQHVEQTDSGLLKQSGPYKGFQSSVLINTHDYPYSKAALATFGARHSTTAGSANHQIPVSAELVPISDALNWAHWKPVADELVAEGICSDSVFTDHMSKYLQGITTALNQYAAYKETESGHGHHALVDRPAVQVPVTWPAGTYGLMKTASGCPAGNSLWREGWRKYDTEDTSSHNSFTSGIQNYLSGEFHSNDIVNRFCMKTSIHSISDGQYDQKWPKGSYCLLKKGSCPSGFGSGYIFWDDEDITNHNGKGGVLPDGTYDKNTKIYYCCRNDGIPSTKIILPTDRPFVLMRYGTTCQMVHGMSVRELYVRWDDEDLFNKDKTSGMHPLDDGGSKDHKIHFCYYQSAAGPTLIG